MRENYRLYKLYKMITKSGIDTSDATAVAEDIVNGKTAYVSGEKIEGSVFEIAAEETHQDSWNQELDIENHEGFSIINFKSLPTDDNYLLRPNSVIQLASRLDIFTNAIGLTPEKIVKGNTILEVSGTAQEGIDTSGATATSEDIITGKTAYINGEKVTGTLGRSYGSSSIVYSDNIEVLEGLTLRFNHTFDEACAFPKGSYFNLQADIDSLINALGLTPDKIKKGETILGITGTYEGEDTGGINHSGGEN